MQLIPDFAVVLDRHRPTPKAKFIEIETGSFKEHEIRETKRHRMLSQGTYTSVKKWRSYLVQVINLSAGELFWIWRMETKKRAWGEKTKAKETNREI